MIEPIKRLIGSGMFVIMFLGCCLLVAWIPFRCSDERTAAARPEFNHPAECACAACKARRDPETKFGRYGRRYTDEIPEIGPAEQ